MRPYTNTTHSDAYQPLSLPFSVTWGVFLMAGGHAWVTFSFQTPSRRSRSFLYTGRSRASPSL